ncbi:hypothetical protein B0H10DRAFT_1942620 [Mycena sp. CBHHK59/15]|nr:hypothetical protein B0H10DRAFT_1942620 [Mycena sp. CBHHK59/15]
MSITSKSKVEKIYVTEQNAQFLIHNMGKRVGLHVVRAKPPRVRVTFPVLATSGEIKHKLKALYHKQWVELWDITNKQIIEPVEGMSIKLIDHHRCKDAIEKQMLGFNRMDMIPEPLEPKLGQKHYRVTVVDAFSKCHSFMVFLVLNNPSWVKPLSDLHQASYKHYLASQFTICYNIYLSILKRVDEQVNKVIGQDSPS